jgi:D-serine deaminase-like pyridoxal phosphate-dependent protein
MPYSSIMTSGDVEISTLDQAIVNSFFKGLPINSHGKTVREFLDSKPSLFSSGFQFPVAVIRETALDHNIARMAQYCKDVNAVISPHVKTTMSPQIAKKQVEAGAWAITVANYFQANVFLDFGFKHIFIANEILESTAIRAIAERNLVPETEIYFYVDSLSGLSIVIDALTDVENAKLNLFIEVGNPGSRGGLRDVADVEPLARRIYEDPRLNLVGISGFEGVIHVDDRSAAGSAEIRGFCQRIVEAAEILRPYVRQREIILTAGGSAYFDIVIDEFAKFEGESLVVLRSGGYVSHDHGGYEATYPFAHETEDKRFHPAIEVWAQVISQPEEGLAILNLGKRDVGNDTGDPFPIKKVQSRHTDRIEPFDGRIDRLNDQHGYLFFEEAQRVGLGDIVGMGISHPCTTFDKWRYIPLVNDQYQVVDLLCTFF